MRRFKILFGALSLLYVSSCTTEAIIEEANLDPNFRVTEAIINKNLILFSQETEIEISQSCLTINLIAGQHYTAGSVTVDVDGNDLVITYSTNGDWVINATHMSIGNCEDQSIPTTGADNPKVGRFEHQTTHEEGTNEVVYRINKEAIDDFYCFAAHAEVVGPTGKETAWAEGIPFGGKNWAMFVEAFLSDCDNETNPDTDTGDDSDSEER